MREIIISGTGIGGLTSAIYLKKAGFDVTVYEKNNYPGGKMNQYSNSGFRFDTGPSLITMPFVYDEFFIANNITERFFLKKLDICCRYFWKDGTVFNYYSDKKKLLNEITNIFGSEICESFIQYLSYSENIYNLSLNSFLNSEFKISEFLNLKGLKSLPQFINFKTLHKQNLSFFKNSKIINVFDRFATYNGSNPFEAPSLFSLIAFVETELAPYYPENGIYSIAENLFSNAEKVGVKFNFNSNLTINNYADKEIKSVSVNNQEINTLNTDIILNYTNINENKNPNNEYSCSGFVIMAGVEGKTESFSHHNILFSSDYENEFNQIFNKKIPADDMTVYISISSKSIKTDAPNNCENWFILVNTPNTSSGINWDVNYVNEYKNKIYEKIESFGFDIKKRIMVEKIITPKDFENNYNSEYGSLYGLSSNGFINLLKRPVNKSKRYNNLFFVGGNTHPGGGVPLCFLSGKIVANLVKKKNSLN